MLAHNLVVLIHEMYQLGIEPPCFGNEKKWYQERDCKRIISWRTLILRANNVGTILMTALLVWNFVFTFLNVLRDLVPAVTLFSSLIYAFGAFSVMVFFFVFHRAQS